MCGGCWTLIYPFIISPGTEARARSWCCRSHWKAFITVFKHQAVSSVTNASLTLRSQRCNYPREVLADDVEFLVKNLSSVTSSLFCCLGFPHFPFSQGQYLSSCGVAAASGERLAGASGWCSPRGGLQGEELSPKYTLENVRVSGPGRQLRKQTLEAELHRPDCVK